MVFYSAFSASRDRANLQLNNRRLERKVKELLMQADDEHLSLTDQKDQVRESLCPRLGQVAGVYHVPCSTHPTGCSPFSCEAGDPGK